MTRRAVIIGVEDYSSEEFLPLQHALEDAWRFKEFLKRLEGTSKFEEPVLLKNPEDGKVLKALATARMGLRAGDLLLVYFAGHGVQQQGRSQQLLLCKDVRPEVIQSDSTNGAIALGALDRMTQGPYDRVFVFDACRNAFLRSEFQLRGGEVGRTMVGAINYREIGARDSSGVARGCTVTIWSCNDGERAAEVDEIRGGLFTHELLGKLGDALKGGSGARLNGAFITEVRKSMEARMGIMLEQTPTISCQNGSIELFPPLGMIEDPTPIPPTTRDATEPPARFGDSTTQPPIVTSTISIPPDVDPIGPRTVEEHLVLPVSAAIRSLWRTVAAYGTVIVFLLFLAALEWSGVAILRRVFPMIGLSTPD